MSERWWGRNAAVSSSPRTAVGDSHRKINLLERRCTLSAVVKAHEDVLVPLGGEEGDPADRRRSGSVHERRAGLFGQFAIITNLLLPSFSQRPTPPLSVYEMEVKAMSSCRGCSHAGSWYAEDAATLSGQLTST